MLRMFQNRKRLRHGKQKNFKSFRQNKNNPSPDFILPQPLNRMVFCRMTKASEKNQKRTGQAAPLSFLKMPGRIKKKTNEILLWQDFRNWTARLPAIGQRIQI